MFMIMLMSLVGTKLYYFNICLGLSGSSWVCLGLSGSSWVLIFPLLLTGLSLCYCRWRKFLKKINLVLKWFDLCVW